MNLHGKNILHDAAQLGDCKLIESILKTTNDLNCVNSLKRSDWTPVMLAVAKGHVPAAEVLLSYGASTAVANKDGWNVLHIACRQGSLEMVRLLVAQNSLLCFGKSRNGRSCLHIAALHGFTDVVAFLTKNNWPLGVDCKDNCGTTPLMDAIRAGNIETALCLVSAGVEITNVDGLQRSLVHIAAQAGCMKSLKFLKATFFEKLDFDRGCFDGSTALMLAAREGHLEAVKFLLENCGVNSQSKDNHGRTALDHALIANRSQVVAILSC